LYKIFTRGLLELPYGSFDKLDFVSLENISRKDIVSFCDR